MENLSNLSNLPLPLTPVDCDLRAFPFMPLDVVRLRDSDISAIGSGDEFRCAVLLWCAAWHQIPSGSLPNDDIVLAQFAGFGRVVKEWKKVRKGALRGWLKCSDGRLYHPVVAEKARAAWEGRLAYRQQKEAERQRKAEERAKKKVAAEQQTGSGCPADKPDLSGGHPAEVQRTSAGNPAENALIGTVDSGQWTGIETQQQPGGGCELKVVNETTSNSRAPRLSEVLGLAGVQAAELDELADGASLDQLEQLKAAYATGMENGTIKNEGAWLARMARKAAVGGITGFKTQGGGGVAISVLNELKAVSVPTGTVISVGDQQLTVDHIDGVPRALDGGFWIGASRTLKVLQRVRAGELSTVLGSSA